MISDVLRSLPGVLASLRMGNYIKEERKKAGLTQEEFAMRAGLGLRFVRELEQKENAKELISERIEILQ